jgi:hypothetical protein
LGDKKKVGVEEVDRSYGIALCISSLFALAGLELLLAVDQGAAGFRELSNARPRCCEVFGFEEEHLINRKRNAQITASDDHGLSVDIIQVMALYIVVQCELCSQEQKEIIFSGMLTTLSRDEAAAPLNL